MRIEIYENFMKISKSLLKFRKVDFKFQKVELLTFIKESRPDASTKPE